MMVLKVKLVNGESLVDDQLWMVTVRMNIDDVTHHWPLAGTRTQNHTWNRSFHYGTCIIFGLRPMKFTHFTIA